VALNTVGTHLEAGATELAMLKFIKRCEVDYAALRTKYFSGVEMVRFPFDSAFWILNQANKVNTATLRGY
jgi:hypothetical protein